LAAAIFTFPFSICTVFAESEGVSLIGQGAPREDIAYAVVDSIAGKVVTQAKKLGGSYGAVCLTGGLCQTEYLPDAIKDRQYYVPGDNKNEQAFAQYWKKIKGEL